jgi:hypothetical protein
MSVEYSLRKTFSPSEVGVFIVSTELRASIAVTNHHIYIVHLFFSQSNEM